jgi:hypothetical protein
MMTYNDIVLSEADRIRLNRLIESDCNHEEDPPTNLSVVISRDAIRGEANLESEDGKA